MDKSHDLAPVVPDTAYAQCIEQASAALRSQAVAVAAVRDDVAVVQQPIKDGCCHDGIAEHAAPLGHRAVARHQHRVS